MELSFRSDIQLRSMESADAESLLAAIDADRANFDRWLRWSSAILTPEAAGDFIRRFSERELENRGFHLGLWRNGALLGGVPCWSHDPVHHVAELGYWLTAAARGEGLATQATRTVAEHLFAQGVNRIEFQCRVENAASRQVAERVGGQFEGVRRQSHWVAGAFRDHAVYAILSTDPPPGSA